MHFREVDEQHTCGSPEKVLEHKEISDILFSKPAPLAMLGDPRNRRKMC